MPKIPFEYLSPKNQEKIEEGPYPEETILNTGKHLRQDRETWLRKNLERFMSPDTADQCLKDFRSDEARDSLAGRVHQVLGGEGRRNLAQRKESEQTEGNLAPEKTEPVSDATSEMSTKLSQANSERSASENEPSDSAKPETPAPTEETEKKPDSESEDKKEDSDSPKVGEIRIKSAMIDVRSRLMAAPGIHEKRVKDALKYVRTVEVFQKIVDIASMAQSPADAAFGVGSYLGGKGSKSAGDVARNSIIFVDEKILRPENNGVNAYTIIQTETYRKEIKPGTVSVLRTEEGWVENEPQVKEVLNRYGTIYVDRASAEADAARALGERINEILSTNKQ